jgi:hypothetical protein
MLCCIVQCSVFFWDLTALENGVATFLQYVGKQLSRWNPLPASLPASFPCKLDTFIKRVKNVVASKGIQVEFKCK